MVQLSHPYITTWKNCINSPLDDIPCIGLLPFPTSLLLSGISYLHSPSTEQVGKEAGSHSLNHAIADPHGALLCLLVTATGPGGTKVSNDTVPAFTKLTFLWDRGLEGLMMETHTSNL